MKPPNYTIKNISEGGDYEVYRNGSIICSCGTEQLANDLIRDFMRLEDTVKTCHEDCRMALSGEWDKSDDGFKATKDACMDALLLVGWEMEEIDYAAESLQTMADEEDKL